MTSTNIVRARPKDGQSANDGLISKSDVYCIIDRIDQAISDNWNIKPEFKSYAEELCAEIKKAIKSEALLHPHVPQGEANADILSGRGLKPLIVEECE